MIFKPINKIKFLNVKSTVPEINKRGIYIFLRNDCSLSYIGQTKRATGQRVKEHTICSVRNKETSKSSLVKQSWK